MRRTLRIWSCLAALAACACGPERVLSESAHRGQHVYQNVCIVCHHGDPNRDGTIGPAIAGSSLELVREKVMRRAYPPGYEPKRTTFLMPAYPFVEEKLPDVVAYLAEVQPPEATSARGGTPPARP